MDQNWRVRKTFVENLIELTDSAPPSFIKDIIMPGFCERLGDTEPSVRVEAIKQLPRFLAHKKVDTEHCTDSAPPSF